MNGDGEDVGDSHIAVFSEEEAHKWIMGVSFRITTSNSYPEPACSGDLFEHVIH